MVDSGSTHNFVDEQVARAVGCITVDIKPIRVTVANGCTLQCKLVCGNFKWSMQGQNFSADMWVLPLIGYDVILGVHWLKTLGEFRWDLNKYTLKFHKGDQEVVLRGILQEDLRWVDERQLSKALHKLEQIDSMQLCSLQGAEEVQVAKTGDLTVTTAISNLLSEFQDVFGEPVGLPPSRTHDHQIPFQEGAILSMSAPISTRWITRQFWSK